MLNEITPVDLTLANVVKIVRKLNNPISIGEKRVYNVGDPDEVETETVGGRAVRVNLPDAFVLTQMAATQGWRVSLPVGGTTIRSLTSVITVIVHV